MNYSGYSSMTYEMRTDVNYSGTFLYFENGYSYEIPDTDYALNRNNSMISQVALACDYNRRLGNVDSKLNFIQFTTNDTPEQYGYLCPTNNIDFLLFIDNQSVSDISLILDGYYINSESESFIDSDRINFYDSTDYIQYNNLSLSYFEANLGVDLGYYSYSVFDYNNLAYPDLFSSNYLIRGEGVTFYSCFLQYDLMNAYPHGIDIKTGNITRAIYQAGFDSGYSNGYGTGRVEGTDAGYQQGLQAGLSQGDGYADTFGYIGNAFNAIGNIMSLEVLPNITLGLAFSIPMTFVLIMTIFKLVRK